jgi:hypothetical protein
VPKADDYLTRYFDSLRQQDPEDPTRLRELGQLSAEQAEQALGQELLRFRKEEDRRALVRHGDEFVAGDRLALFAAIEVCATWGWRLPRWAATAFAEGWRKIQDFEARSLDEAFGNPYPKGKHLHRDREALELRWRIWVRVYGRWRFGKKPMDEALFEEVGDELGVAPSRARDLYYSVVDDIKSGRGDLVRIFPAK